MKVVKKVFTIEDVTEQEAVAQKPTMMKRSEYPAFEDRYDGYKPRAGHGETQIAFQRITDLVAAQIWTRYQTEVMQPVNGDHKDARRTFNQAVEALNRDFKAGIELNANTSIILTAQKLLTHVRELVLDEATRAASFKVRNGSFNPKLDKVARAVNQVLFNAYLDEYRFLLEGTA